MAPPGCVIPTTEVIREVCVRDARDQGWRGYGVPERQNHDRYHREGTLESTAQRLAIVLGLLYCVTLCHMIWCSLL